VLGEKEEEEEEEEVSLPAAGYGVVHEEGDESIQEDVECGA
jgi:hypothetical protein